MPGTGDNSDSRESREGANGPGERKGRGESASDMPGLHLMTPGGTQGGRGASGAVTPAQMRRKGECRNSHRRSWKEGETSGLNCACSGGLKLFSQEATSIVWLVGERVGCELFTRPCPVQV